MSENYNQIKLQFGSQTNYIDVAQSLGEKLFEILSFNGDAIYWMSIALREALNNAVKHGNKQNPLKSVFVNFNIHPDKLQILIRDEGKGFDLSEIPDPTEKENIMKSCGRGLFFIKSFMDEFEILECGKKGTLLSMVKYKSNKHKPRR